MSCASCYALVGVGLFSIGLHALFVYSHLLRKILAINVMASGIFLVFVALAKRAQVADAVPEAMVITGIVVSVSATALALVLMLRLSATTGSAMLPDDDRALH